MLAEYIAFQTFISIHLSLFNNTTQMILIDFTALFSQNVMLAEDSAILCCIFLIPNASDILILYSLFFKSISNSWNSFRYLRILSCANYESM